MGVLGLNETTVGEAEQAGEVVELWTCIWEVLGYNLGRDTNWLKVLDIFLSPSKEILE